MTEPVFEFRFSGKDANLVGVPLRDLADLLLSIEQSVVSVALSLQPETDVEKLTIGLIGVEEGSALFRFGVAIGAVLVTQAAGTLGLAIERRDYTGIPAKAISGLRDLDRYSKAREWDVELRDGAGDHLLARISPDVEMQLPILQVIEGRTTIYGYLRRVGGVVPRAWIKTISGDSLSAITSESLAKQMAGRLYEMVGLAGTARWDALSGEILHFRAEEITPFSEAPFDQVLNELADAIGVDGWVDVGDVGEYVRELRGDLEP